MNLQSIVHHLDSRVPRIYIYRDCSLGHLNRSSGEGIRRSWSEPNQL